MRCGDETTRQTSDSQMRCPLGTILGDSVTEGVSIPAAYRLLGRELPGAWKVIEQLNWKVDPATGLLAGDGYGTGGTFGVGYIVERGDERAFLKAINLAKIAERPDIIAAMTEITAEVNFEREIHRVCAEGNMDRVVRAIDSNQIGLGPNPQDQVPYIILELADGDVRRRLRKVEAKVQTVWKLRALHSAATGLQQLHSREIAHQDLKPSNLMSFDAIETFKIGDFGRSIRQGIKAPHEDLLHAGDMSYAPPELLYAQVDPDWRMRRLKCDLYMLGGLICWSFLGYAVTPFLVDRLAIQHRPQWFRGHWRGDYNEVLPYVRHAFGTILNDFKSEVPLEFRDQLGSALEQLCEPDPHQRGHPYALAQKHGNKYDLSRYVSLFDLLAKQASRSARSTT